MDFWNAMQDLPTFWTTGRTLGAAVNGAVVLALLIMLSLLEHHSVAGRARREPDASAADQDTMPLPALGVVAATVSLLVWGCMWGEQNASRFDYVRGTAVDYVQDTYDVVALSPVELTDDHLYPSWLMGSASAVTAGSFQAVKPNGEVVDVTITWLAHDIAPYRADKVLPKSMDWVTVKLEPTEPANAN